MVRYGWLLAALALIAPPLRAAEEKVLDDGQFASVEVLRAAWVTAEGGLPAASAEGRDGPAVKLSVDFTNPEMRRLVYDRRLDEDFSRWDRISFDVFIDDPSIFSGYTAYFQAPGGWFGTGFSARRGWNTLTFTKASFKREDSPAGWEKILGFRVAGWRGTAKAGFMLVDNLKVYREPLVIVMDTRIQGSEYESAQRIAGGLGDALAEVGVVVGSTTDQEAEKGGLAGRELAILAHNPSITPALIDALRAFVAAGGKVMAFYQFPAALAELLGVRTVGWSREEYPGQLSAIHFDAPEIVGLPAVVSQHSWNQTKIQPIEGKSKAIAWWHDSEGKNTGLPTFVLSDAGLAMSHVMVSTDPARGRMLLALVGHFVPRIWSEATELAIAGPSRVGHVDGLAAAEQWIAAAAEMSPQPALVRQKLQASQAARRQARTLREQKQWPASVEASEQADILIREAYLLAQHPRRDEFRACWNHSGTGAFGTWAQSMKNLHESGFNAVVPNMLWGGVALYDSELLPHHPVVAQRGDQIAECVAAAKPYGLQVHVWKVNWNLGHAVPEAFKQKLRAENRLQVDLKGTTIDWLCPSDERNQALEADSMIEVAQKYEVDGVHFDYIRYPGTESCFCDRCRERFETSLGRKLTNWPADTRLPEVKAAWTQFRCDNISRLVQRVAEGVRRVKPACRISAAVFRDYPSCRDGVGQDWIHWIKQGWIDFICPMTYTDSDDTFRNWAQQHVGYIEGRVPLYPGIGVTSSNSTLSPDRTAGQVQITREQGADGFIIFNYGPREATGTLPPLRLGALGEPGLQPHDAPAYRFEVGPLETDQVTARQVASGQAVSVTVTRAEDIAGRGFGAVKGEVVLEDVMGSLVSKLADAPATGSCQVTVKAADGVYRVAVRGSVPVNGRPRSFVTRSLPLQFGR
ncbi:MAG: family 10 glycosylhydrolase [Armatimonadetes bacterium]|nr:family 10 glycosylhydrolase [Armatimonadota bacterium]